MPVGLDFYRKIPDSKDREWRDSRRREISVITIERCHNSVAIIAVAIAIPPSALSLVPASAVGAAGRCTVGFKPKTGIFDNFVDSLFPLLFPSFQHSCRMSESTGRAMSWRTLFSTVRSHREDTPLLHADSNDHDDGDNMSKADIWSHRWIPGYIEEDYRRTSVVEPQPIRQPHRRRSHYHHRTVRRRIFLFLTDPTSSYASIVFFIILVIAIAGINVIMFMQTMDAYQFVPDDCVSCNGTVYYVLEDDNFVPEPGIPCVCPPAPLNSTVKAADYIVYFFTVEWILRVLFYEPPPAERARTCWGFFCQWLSYLTDTTTVLDALAIFPYYAERFEKTNGLMSLRLLRLFRVFQLVRLGQYNESFMSLTNVLYKSVLFLKLLIVVLMFGAAFFGSIVYWLEKGDWKYYDKTQSYEFLRKSVDGLEEEPTPFTSIPVAFWWFLVTATTVGYGKCT